MLQHLHHLFAHHDLNRVGYAMLICWVSSLAAVAVLTHVRRPGVSHMRMWLVGAATSAGFGIWATHFVAMAGFHADGVVAFRLDLTFSSLGLVIAGLYGAFSGCTVARSPITRAAFGAFAGLAIGGMHYLGMAGLVLERQAIWNLWGVAASLAVGMSLGALAFGLIASPSGMLRRMTVVSLFAGATLCIHFIGMAAYSTGAFRSIGQEYLLISSTGLDQTVIVVSLMIVFVIYLGVGLHGHDLALREEMRHMTELSNATIEALLICDGNHITAANENFLLLAQCGKDAIIGADRSVFMPLSADVRDSLDRGAVAEAILLTTAGEKIDVEIHAHNVSFGGKQQTALAILDIRKRKAAEDEIRHLANYDLLTQIPNRSCFYRMLREEIEKAGLTGTKVALICIDLDNFKQINDQYGHRVGDEFLQRATEVMTSVLREGQVLGRVGGDEFALILPDIGCADNAGKLAEDILAAFVCNNTAVGKSVNLSGSMGIALFPDDAANKLELMTAADSAMYKAKREGRQTYRFFDTGLAFAMRERCLLELDLREAIDKGELGLVYQRQVDCRTGNVLGMEALLRWHSPARGAVSPDVFVPIAEECGEIGRIGEWVLENACCEAASWDKSLNLAVNVSFVQLLNIDFVRRLHEVILQSGLAPSRLEIEITETALVKDRQRALDTMRRIKNLGVRISMDDFGAGYSSFYNLHYFPFDKIKIDKSFIKNINTDDQAAAIVRAIIALGRELKLKVLAEGVETSEEMCLLKRFGCTEAQGYFIGRPGSYDDYKREFMRPGLPPTARSA